VTVLPAPLGARAVVVGGTAWHVVAADVDPAWVAAQVADDPIAAPLGARFLAALADRVGAEPGSLDAVLVAPALVPDGEPLWAQVATANTASLRAFLAAGYRPVAAEVLFGP
jgi:hypothetical protein